MHEILITAIAFLCGYITAEYSRYLSREFEEVGKNLVDKVVDNIEE